MYCSAALGVLGTGGDVGSLDARRCLRAVCTFISEAQPPLQRQTLWRAGCHSLVGEVRVLCQLFLVHARDRRLTETKAVLPAVRVPFLTPLSVVVLPQSKASLRPTRTAAAARPSRSWRARCAGTRLPVTTTASLPARDAR